MVCRVPPEAPQLPLPTLCAHSRLGGEDLPWPLPCVAVPGPFLAELQGSRVLPSAPPPQPQPGALSCMPKPDQHRELSHPLDTAVLAWATLWPPPFYLIPCAGLQAGAAPACG